MSEYQYEDGTLGRIIEDATETAKLSVGPSGKATGDGKLFNDPMRFMMSPVYRFARSSEADGARLNNWRPSQTTTHNQSVAKTLEFRGHAFIPDPEDTLDGRRIMFLGSTTLSLAGDAGQRIKQFWESEADSKTKSLTVSPADASNYLSILESVLRNPANHDKLCCTDHTAVLDGSTFVNGPLKSGGTSYSPEGLIENGSTIVDVRVAPRRGL